MDKHTRHERRAFPVDSFQVELRAEGEAAAPKLVGYAAVFNRMSQDLGGFTEIIKPGAFRKTIQESDVRALFNHDSNFVLGRSKSGTLKMEEDDRGLKIEISPPDTGWARDLLHSIERGDVDQMSFAFRAVKDRWIEDNDKQDRAVIRELHEVRLFDVSPVTYPAYEDTTISVRDLIASRAKQGRTLSDEEKHALRGLLDDAPAEPPPAGHSDPIHRDESIIRIALMRRRLDLLERTRS
jgi:HK97 family phage prohead protease